MVDTVILIVDDDRTIVRLCQRLLERSAFQVVTAIDPLDALKVLEQRKIDLLLSDIRMPVMDGFELIRMAKQYQPDLPVLVMTGYGSIDTAIQALHRGVDGLILKPFENSSELIQAVQRVLEESKQKRDAARLLVLRPLFDVTERLLAETAPLALEELILDSVFNLFQVQFAGIYRKRGNKSALETVRIKEADQAERNAEIGGYICAEVAAAAPAVYNISGPDSSPEVQKYLQKMGLASLLVARVQQNDSHLVFCASRGEGSPLFAEADLEMFVILARQAAVAMENARLYSDLRDYVRQIEESQRALVQAEKMAAVGRLMASMAHEINNPLQAVRNGLHLAARKEIESEKRFQFMDMTANELERLVKTVRRMLDFYRPGGDEWEVVDLIQIINKVLVLLDPQMRDQGVKLHLHFPQESVIMFASPDQIHQVFFNLLINAIDSFEECGKNRHEEPNEIWIDVYLQQQQVQILIEDSGIGIAVELQERVFEPFVSTKKNGTGLGLSVSYGIMERHQGSLKVIPPRYRNGACFEMTLPVGGD
jgi:signal transduction histidine kinase/CheY-like chemotaxis protein